MLTPKGGGSKNQTRLLTAAQHASWLQVPQGYDVCYVLHSLGPQARALCKGPKATDTPQKAVVVKHKPSGRQMEIWTTVSSDQLVQLLGVGHAKEENGKQEPFAQGGGKN